jgi:hypothetical protein
MSTVAEEIAVLKSAVNMDMRMTTDLLKQASSQVQGIWKALELIAERIDADAPRP